MVDAEVIKDEMRGEEEKSLVYQMLEALSNERMKKGFEGDG